MLRFLPWATGGQKSQLPEETRIVNREPISLELCFYRIALKIKCHSLCTIAATSMPSAS